MKPLFLGAYWSARKEDQLSCAIRLSDFLKSIGCAEPTLDRWFLKGRKRNTGNKLDVSPTGICSALRSNKRDTDGEVIEELGFSLSVWNGNGISFTATLGSFSPYIANASVLSCDADHAMAAETWRLLIERAAQAFDPDCAVVTSYDYISRHGNGSPCEAGGWFRYMRNNAIEERLFP
jgi:hypothetical protein